MTAAQVAAPAGICLKVIVGESEPVGDRDGDVCCLACGTPYTVGSQLPGVGAGCPACGNLTWIASTFAPQEHEPRRSGGDQPRSRTG